MPTVLRKAGFAVMIYTYDHLPMHVHVFHGGDEALFYLGNDEEAPSLRENRGMKQATIRRALHVVAKNQIYLIEKWREIHAQDE